MATCITIEMVEKFLKRIGATTSPTSSSSEIVVVYLDGKVYPSPGWEHFLDSKTRVIYFVNKRIDQNQDKTTRGSYMRSTSSSDAIDINNNNNSVEQSPMEEDPANVYLELMACKRCSKYMLTAKETKDCPRCGETLINFINKSGI